MTVALTIPVASRWRYGLEERFLNALLTRGRRATAEVTEWRYRGKSARNKAIYYAYGVGERPVSSSIMVGESDPRFAHVPETLPILYDPLCPSNHLVSAWLSRQDVEERLSRFWRYALGGLAFALIEVCVEIAVIRQMGLARNGVRTVGTVVDLGRTDGRGPLRVTFEFLTASGEPIRGVAANSEVMGIHFGRRWPELVYDPCKPDRYMLIDTMWAVCWPSDSMAAWNRAEMDDPRAYSAGDDRISPTQMVLGITGYTIRAALGLVRRRY